MSNFPNQLDSDVELPAVSDNITEIGGDAINGLRSATFNIESNIGIGAAGTTSSIANRLNVSLNPDGTIMPSVLIGLLSLVQITNAQVSPTAEIAESKLALTYSTSSLYNLISILSNSVDVLNGFLSLVGVKLEPHIDGTNYNHLLSAIQVDPTVPMLKIAPSTLPTAGTNIQNRNTINADTLIKDISDDLLTHEKLDGSANVLPTTGGTVPPLNYAHMGSGIYVNPDNFSTIPQSNNDVQSIIEYFDNSSLLLLGSRIQNLYSNGISRTARSSSFLADGYGEPLVPPTPVVAYLLNEPPGPMSSSPVDNFNNGDDIILFNPTSQQLSTFNFDAQFAQVQPGDLITVDYGTGISYQFLIDSIKSSINGNIRTYAVRINGKNPVSDANAIARIDRSTFHRGKYGVLASARAPNSAGVYESLIISNPKSAMALGNGFNPSEFNQSHYNLYLTLLSNGDTSNILQLPAIDITGNQGITPGSYTLDDIVENTNIAFRAPGFNYRFIAFQYAGQFGIMLADPYNNASFSIVSGTVDGYGNYNASSLSQFLNNVVDNFAGFDPLGFGLSGANIATPPPAISYSNVNAAAYNPTIYFYPLKRNFFYTDGVERDTLRSDPNILNNIIDQFGDGYWPATILPAPATKVLTNRVEVVYQVNLDLSTSGLKNGKTLVVQPAFPLSDPRYNFRDYGRFIIKDVSFNNCDLPTAYTNITVYDGVHAVSVSPSATSTNIPVNLYFSDDSVSFSTENVFDITASGPFKRFFEVYVDGNGHTTTHERARFINTSIGISNFNLYKVSPKLRGYDVNNDREIRFTIINYDQITGIYSGFLARWNPISMTNTNIGATVVGKKGDIVRFYDETTVDYIDFTIDIDSTITSFTNNTMDIQLFKTLELDEEIMLLSSCQVDDITKQVSYLKDERQFGNVSEEQFSTSALDYISAPQRLLNENGIINGFDNVQTSSNIVSFNGGTVLIDGKIIFISNSTISIPNVVETLYPSFTTTVSAMQWFVCANKKSEIELIASTDYNPSLISTYGSLDQNRIFYVKDLDTNAVYPIRATYFDNLVSTLKDVVPLFVINAPTSNTNIAALDARRYVSNGYGGLQNTFVLSPNGSFRTFNAISTWIDQLNDYISSNTTNNNTHGNKIIIKGTNILGSITFSKQIVIDGDSGAITTQNAFFSTTFQNVIVNNLTINIVNDFVYSIGSNARFNNCIINVSVQGGFPIFGSNVEFNNCTINYTYDATADSSFSTSVLSNYIKSCFPCSIASSASITNISFNGCTFVTPNQNHFPFISFIFQASTSFAEEISITNNIFQTTTTTDDKLAVITFVGPSVSPTATNGPRLNNCLIENNYCNKNQLILISSPLVGSNVMDLIAVTNTTISNNTCGAINVLTKRDLPLLTANTTTSGSADKLDGITISNNTCKFIYNGFADGNFATSTGTQAASTVQNNNFLLFTSSMRITENMCSYIYIGYIMQNISTNGQSQLLIKNNKLYAYNPSYLTQYFGNITQSSAIAIIVNKYIGS